jgi:hypothetical protein
MSLSLAHSQLLFVPFKHHLYLKIVLQLAYMKNILFIL